MELRPRVLRLSGCGGRPSVSTGQSWMGLRPRLLGLSGGGGGGRSAGHGLQLRGAVTYGRVISSSAGETPPGTQ